jgi:N-acetylmuramic acid 6-phosphate etherase
MKKELQAARGIFAGANTALLFVTGCGSTQPSEIASQVTGKDGVTVPVILPARSDPLTVRRQIALKMLLNAHSTGVMAALGRVVGNTMTNVSPSNLKLIGRATSLILSHVNDTIGSAQWQAESRPAAPVRFSEANPVLFDAMGYVRDHDMGQTAEVSLSIIRILEALRRREPVSWDEARGIQAKEGLAAYLFRLNRSLGLPP